MGTTIRKATTKADREAVFRLRYDVSVSQLGRESDGIDHDRRWIKDEADEHGTLFLAEDEGKPVGTVRVSFARSGSLPNQKWFPIDGFRPHWPKRISATDRLVVLPEFRSGMIPGRLALKCFETGIQEGIYFDFVLSRSHLVPMYQQLGYRFAGGSVNHSYYGTIYPMVLVVTDQRHLAASRSPFQRIARRHPESHEARILFESAHPSEARRLPSGCLDPESLWTSFGRRLFDQQGGKDQLLSGFDREEILQILPRLTELSFQSGETIVSQGEIGLGLFCLVEGSAEARVRNGGWEQTLGVLEPGMVFGELGFVTETPRTATVTSTGRCRVVILPGSEFQKLKKSRPELALKLMSNLFTTVSRRYSQLQRQFFDLESRTVTSREERMAEAS